MKPPFEVSHGRPSRQSRRAPDDGHDAKQPLALIEDRHGKTVDPGKIGILNEAVAGLVNLGDHCLKCGALRHIANAGDIGAGLEFVLGAVGHAGIVRQREKDSSRGGAGHVIDRSRPKVEIERAARRDDLGYGRHLPGPEDERDQEVTLCCDPLRQWQNTIGLANHLEPALSQSRRQRPNGMTFRIGVEFEQPETLKARQIRSQLSWLKPGRGRNLNQARPLAQSGHASKDGAEDLHRFEAAAKIVLSFHLFLRLIPILVVRPTAPAGSGTG